MSDDADYRCFIGNLSWTTSDRGLKEAFEKFGHVIDAKVVNDKYTGRSRGFGFVTFDGRSAMEEAIEAMNGMDLDGRSITVDKAQPDGERGRDRDRGRDYGGGGGGRGSGNGECFKCGKPGHFARECPDEGGRGGKYGGREDRYGGGGRDDRYGGGGGGGGRDDRYGGGGRNDRYGGGGRDDRHGGSGGSRYGSERNGDRSGGRSRDGGGGGERYSRDRSGPYDRRG